MKKKNKKKEKSPFVILAWVGFFILMIIGYAVDDEPIDNKPIASISKNDSASYYNRGVAKFDLGNNDEAIEDFDKAIELNPQYGSAYFTRGVAKNELGEYDDAIKDYDKAIEFKPQLVWAYVGRAAAKESLAKIERANGNEAKAQKLEREARTDKAKGKKIT